MRRAVLLATAVLVVLGAGGAVPAHAHTDILAVWPEEGARVTAPRWAQEAAQEVAATRRPGSGRSHPELWVLGLGLGALALALIRGRRTPHTTRSGQSDITPSGQSHDARNGQ